MNIEDQKFNGTKLREQREQLAIAEKWRNAFLIAIVNKKHIGRYCEFSTICIEIIDTCNQALIQSQKRDGWKLLLNEAIGILNDALPEMEKVINTLQPKARLLIRIKFISMNIALNNSSSVVEHVSCLHMEILKMNQDFFKAETLTLLYSTIETGYQYLAAQVIDAKKDIDSKNTVVT